MAIALGTPGAGALNASPPDTIELSADFRIRFESDFDSERANGTRRDDRTRARIRARVKLVYRHARAFSFGIRVRSGSDDSQQSPHITVLDFDGNDTGDADFNLDQWYLRGQLGGGWLWVGRNNLPFWKDHELFWDDDVTPAGIGAGYEASLGRVGSLGLSGGYFSLPVGMRQFSGNVGAGQLKYERKLGEVGLTAAAGLLAIEADPEDPDAEVLLNGNGGRDYTIWIGSARAGWKVRGVPLLLGADLLHNSRDYSAADAAPLPASEADQTEGFLITARAGQLSGKGGWLAAYYYARIETFAVNSSYAQDDWVRWGSATETRASNMRGHELRVAHAFTAAVNVVARLYLTEALTTDEDGNRFRIDFNYRP
ncbi:MAG: putative porin [Gemmatimonadota bacterium]